MNAETYKAPGTRTSVYLVPELAARVKDSGTPLAELIRRGLDAGEPEPAAAALERIDKRLRAIENTLGRITDGQPESVHKGKSARVQCEHRNWGRYCPQCHLTIGKDGYPA
jgi:uncharacterized membrane protein YccC